MIRNSVVGWTACVFLCYAAAVTLAEQPTVAELYNRGVSAYFSGDVEQALVLLSEVCKRSPDDPRAFYFHGLAQAARLGMDAALPDWTHAAMLEATAVMPAYDVDDALERIQGALRVEIERQRKAARQAAIERRKRQEQARYEQLKRREAEVLFDPKRPLPTIDFPLPAVKVEQDPFATGLVLSGGKSVEAQPASATIPSTGSSPVAPDVRDPFASPTESAPAAKVEPAAPAANPFGDMGGAAKVPAEDPAGAPDAAPPAGGSGSMFGSVMDMVGKTLSGQAGPRDPFAKSAEGPAKQPVETPPAEAPETTPAPPEQPPVPAKKAPTPSNDPFK